MAFETYCFHSNAWRNLFINLFEFVCKCLPVLRRLNRCYRCPNNLYIKSANVRDNGITLELKRDELLIEEATTLIWEIGLVLPSNCFLTFDSSLWCK